MQYSCRVYNINVFCAHYEPVSSGHNYMDGYYENMCHFGFIPKDVLHRLFKLKTFLIKKGKNMQESGDYTTLQISFKGRRPTS